MDFNKHAKALFFSLTGLTMIVVAIIGFQINKAIVPIDDVKAEITREEKPAIFWSVIIGELACGGYFVRLGAQSYKHSKEEQEDTDRRNNGNSNRF